MTKEVLRQYVAKEFPNADFESVLIGLLLFIPIEDLPITDHADVLASSPNGDLHITNYRHAYDIFSVQDKCESNLGWLYKPLTIE